MSGAIEIKDRNSNVRLTLNAQGAAFIDTINPISVQGTVTATPTGTQTVNGTVLTVPGLGTGFTGVYAFTSPDTPGVVAANNFLSIFNPVGSGKSIYLLGGSLACYLTGGGSTTKNSMLLSRTTAASGGTLQASSSICNLVSTYATPVAEVRTGNPTVTLGAVFAASSPGVNPNTTSSPVHRLESFPGSGPFVLAPGEGMVARTAVGDTDQNWNINLFWAEA